MDESEHIREQIQDGAVRDARESRRSVWFG